MIREPGDMPLPAQRGHVKVVIGAEQRIDAVGVRRAGVEDAVALAQEDAYPGRVRPDRI